MQVQLLSAISVNAGQSSNVELLARLVPHAAGLAEMHPDPVVRYRVFMVLGAHTMTVAPVLAACLSDPRRRTRRLAAFTLGELASHNSSVTNMVSQTAPAPSDPVLRALAKEVLPKLTMSLADSCAQVRATAANALMLFGIHAAVAVKALSSSLTDPHIKVRETVATVLGKLAAKLSHRTVQEECVIDMSALAQTLLQSLKDEHLSVRTAVVTALGQLGVHAGSDAAKAVAATLQDSDEDVRAAAACSLGQIGRSSSTCIPLLINVLQDGDDVVRESAAVSLGLFSFEAAPAVAALMHCLQDPVEGVRRTAITALGQIGDASEPAVTAMARSLKDASPEVQKAAARALGHLGAKSVPVVPMLARALKAQEDALRVAAASALGDLGPLAASAIGPLTERIKDTSPEVRAAALAAIVQMGGHAAPAVPALLDLMNDGLEEVREAASTAVNQIMAQVNFDSGHRHHARTKRRKPSALARAARRCSTVHSGTGSTRSASNSIPDVDSGSNSEAESLLEGSDAEDATSSMEAARVTRPRSSSRDRRL